MKNKPAITALLIALFFGSIWINRHMDRQATVTETFKIPEAVAQIPEEKDEVIYVTNPTITPASNPEPTEEPVKKEPIKTVTPQTASVALPKLVIPTANVNAHIIPVGVTATNNLDVPPNYTEVGWYKYGPRPGEQGNVVLDAHVDNGANIPGPFKHLRKAKVGDEISIHAEDGSEIKYRIIRTDVYWTKEFPSELIFHEKGGALLKLITCHGTFIPSEDTYDQRLVVTAALIQ